MRPGNLPPALAVAGRVLYWLTLCLLLAGTCSTVYWFKHGHYQLLSVQSNSMRPAFAKGDALLVHAVATNTLQPGSIVSYRSPVNPQLVVSHRLLALDRQTKLLTTKGDALRSNDPGIPADALVGEATALIPGGGKLIDVVRKPVGLLVFVYVPATIVVAYELRRLLKVQSGRTYRSYSYR